MAAEAQLRGFQDATDLPARRAEEERRDIESIQWRHHPTPQSARVPTDDSFTATVAQVLHARRQGASEEVVGEILDRGPRNLSRMAQRVVREVEAMTSSKSARVKDVLDAGPPLPKLDHAAIAGVGQRGVGLCRVYKATEAELASFGVASVEEMVDQLNSHLDKIKDDPIYASYPTSRAAFQRLAFRWRCLEVSSKD